MILKQVSDAVAAGARQEEACDMLGVSARTLERWRERGVGDDVRRGPKSAPKNTLSARERHEALEALNSPAFRDLSPKQIVPQLADLGVYLASESTLYRILRQEDLLKHRESYRAPSKRHKPAEHVARGPNEVWSWDITYLKTEVRGAFFYLYLVVDVWSRKIVAWELHTEESAEHASVLLSAACQREGVSAGTLVVHSDNGAPMKGATLKATLDKLGVTPSYSRPSVSNDNPYSESLFRTMKYQPAYPSGPFRSAEAARQWVAGFVRWYNTVHLHSAIRFVTAADRHAGRDIVLLQRRRMVYEAARRRTPQRWSGKTRDWSHIEEVRLNPDEVTMPMTA
jgi:transposase InsO family protein